MAIIFLWVLTQNSSKASTNESSKDTHSTYAVDNICQLGTCENQETRPGFRTPTGPLRSFHLNCPVSARDSLDHSCELPLEDLTHKINSQVASQTVTVYFILECPREYNLKVIFSKSSDNRMKNLISYLILIRCDVMLENLGIFGTVVDLRVLMIYDFTEWIDEQSSSFYNRTGNTTSEPSSSINHKIQPPIVGLEDVGTLVLSQTKSNNRSVPLALYNRQWPLMAELEITNLTAAWGKVNEFRWTMPKLQDLRLQNVMESGIPDFPWYEGSLKLPQELIRTVSFNALYRRDPVLSVEPNLYLRSLTLSGTKIGNLTNILFHGRLSIIDLSNCKLSNIGYESFHNLKNLQLLVLKNNLLTELPYGVFQNLTSLKKLDLSFNHLNTLSKEIFIGLRNLKILLINNNYLKRIVSHTFSSLPSLVHLDLSNNYIETAARDALGFDSNNLTEVNLNNNSLYHFPIWVFSTKSLRVVHLSKNKLSFAALTNDLNKGDVQEIYDSATLVSHKFRPAEEKKIILHQNNFSILNFENSTKIKKRIMTVLMNFFKLDVSHNDILCDCHTYNLRKFFLDEKLKPIKEDFSEPRIQEYYYKAWNCSKPHSVKDQPIVVAPAEAFMCQKALPHCPDSCVCYERAIDQSVLVNCSKKKLNTLPAFLPNGTDTLDLSYNHLTKLYKVSYLSMLKVLDLSHNSLKIIESDVVESLDRMDILYLHYNEIQYLPNTFNSLWRTSLYLGDNLFICDCHSKWLVKWLISYQAKIKDVDKIICSSGNLRSQLIYKTNPNDFTCEISNTLFRTLVIALVVFMLVLVTLTAILYKFRGEIKVFLYFHFNWHPFDKTDDTDVINKLYDAFVSYSRADVGWVLNTLQPALEAEEKPYRLCIHERDFAPGGLITDNVLYSVKYSRRMIMVLTRDFLKSEWCRLEFKSAHRRVLKDRTNYLIVILFDDINIDELDEDMKLYLRTNTYIAYNSRWFWQRLFYAMPQKPLLTLRGDVFPTKGYGNLFPIPESVAAMQREHNRKLQAKGKPTPDVSLDVEFM